MNSDIKWEHSKAYLYFDGKSRCYYDSFKATTLNFEQLARSVKPHV